MKRFIRFVLATSAVALGVVAAQPAEAVDTVAYSWIVPCSDANGVSTSETDISFIPGEYAVTAVGA